MEPRSDPANAASSPVIAEFASQGGCSEIVALLGPPSWQQPSANVGTEHEKEVACPFFAEPISLRRRTTH